MSIRETLSERPQVGVGIGVAAIAIAGAVVWSTLFASSPTASLPSHLYFSDDDGKTFFVDDSSNIPPFDHGGKEALQAAVFQCGGNKFVGYLIRYDKGAKAALEAMPEADRKGSNPKALEIRKFGEQVKKPGDKNWVSANSEQPIAQIISPACPDGSDQVPTQITP